MPVDTFDFQRALEDATKPLNDYSSARTSMALADIARQQHLGDVASERAYEQQAADKASQRRISEFDKMDTLRLAEEFAKMGVDTTDKDGQLLPKDKLLSNYRSFQKVKAENLLSHFNGQLTINQKNQEAAIQRIQNTVTKKATPEQNRKALIVTLTDPVASKDIPDDQKQKLQKILNGPGDPDKVVHEVYDYMTKNYWIRKGAAQSEASAFMQKYLNEVNASLDQSKQIDVLVYTKELDDLNRESQGITAQRERHVLDYAPFLPQESVAGTAPAAVVTPPKDPNEAFANAKPLVPPPAPFAASAGEPPTLNVRPNSKQPFVSPLAPVETQRTSLSPVMAGVPATNRDQLMSALSDIQQKMQSGQKEQLMKATPEETAEVKRVGESEYGFNVPLFEQKLSFGAPEAVMSFNTVLKEIRNRRAGVNTSLPPVGMPSR